MFNDLGGLLHVLKGADGLAILVAGHDDDVELGDRSPDRAVDLLQVAAAQNVRHHAHPGPRLGAERDLLPHHVLVAAAPDPPEEVRAENAALPARARRTGLARDPPEEVSAVLPGRLFSPFRAVHGRGATSAWRVRGRVCLGAAVGLKVN